MRICESLFAALSLGLGQGRPICNELTSCLCAGGHSRHLESVQTPAWPLQLSLRLPLCGLCVPFPSHPSPAHCPPAAPSSTCRTPTDFPAFALALAVLPTQDGLQFIPVHCSDLCSNTTKECKLVARPTLKSWQVRSRNTRLFQLNKDSLSCCYVQQSTIRGLVGTQRCIRPR